MFDLDMIKVVYAQMADKINSARDILNRPMTLAEKILYSHLHNKNLSNEILSNAPEKLEDYFIVPKVVE